MDCLFCKISNNEIPSYKIYEDELTKVFLDIKPNADGHMLIIPKKHYVDILDVDLELLKHINNVSKKMYQLLKDKLNVDGLTIAQNNGSAEDVKHYHLHLIPRYKNDSVHSIYPNEKKDIKVIFELLTK
ncbi:MAG: HIT domain-containing protein [Bacilli bacterium]|nr:HIT domain-containing protein [Bacilli bacterium]